MTTEPFRIPKEAFVSNVWDWANADGSDDEVIVLERGHLKDLIATTRKSVLAEPKKEPKPKTVVDEIFDELHKPVFNEDNEILRLERALKVAVDRLDKVSSWALGPNGDAKTGEVVLKDILAALRGQSPPKLRDSRGPQIKPYWTCTSCKNTNADHWMECLVCGKKRLEGNRPDPRFWECRGCTHLERDAISKCTICGNLRKKDQF